MDHNNGSHNHKARFPPRTPSHYTGNDSNSLPVLVAVGEGEAGVAEVIAVVVFGVDLFVIGVIDEAAVVSADKVVRFVAPPGAGGAAGSIVGREEVFGGVTGLHDAENYKKIKPRFIGGILASRPNNPTAAPRVLLLNDILPTLP